MKRFLTILLSLIVVLSSVLLLSACGQKEEVGGLFSSDGQKLKKFKSLTESMSPEISAGSTIYYEEVDPDDLEVGDIVVYKMPATYANADEDMLLIAHRIVEIVEDEENPGERCFITKGDANHIADQDPVKGEDIVGIVVKWK